MSTFVIYTLSPAINYGVMAISVDERTELKSAVRELLHDRCTEADVRRVIDTDEGFDGQLWRQLAEQGVTGVLVDDGYGGVGLGPLEVETVAEEIGAALLPSPWLSSAVLTVALIQAAGSEDDQRRLLPGLADGTSIGTVAVTGERGTWTPDGVTVQASADDTLSGSAHYVTWGQVADVILVVADTADGIGVFEVAPDADGLTRSMATVFDPTVRLSTFTFQDTPARRLGTAGWGAVQDALDFASIALAGEQVGGSRRIFDITIDYLKTRIQFGRAIGSFQALKHMAADLLLENESAMSAAHHAAATKAAQSEKSIGAIALAGFVCAETYESTAMHAIQLHGGIGFTWEHPAHLFLRRARTGMQLFGAPALYRERYLVSKGA